MIFSKIRQSTKKAGRLAGRKPRVPDGVRAYAIGDVHGRDDLLGDLLTQIEADIAKRPLARNHIIMLGDLIDRGPDSCGVLERLRRFNVAGCELHVVSGNHEEVLLRLLEGEYGILPSWLKFGGEETLKSYGADVERIRCADEPTGLRLIRAAIPATHQAFLRSLDDTVRVGDYLFVHAGIRPLVALADQSQNDLRWIRQPFLSDDRDHGFMVIHGHTITDEVAEKSNRIGIDTGAYQTGKLTALGIEGTLRWYLEAGGPRGGSD